MRRLTVFLAVLAAVAVIGVVVMRIDSHESTASTDAVVDDHQPKLPPAEPSDDIEEARSAAVTAVALTDEVARAGFISRRELIESFTTPSYGPTLADETSAAVTAMLLDLGERDVNPADLHVVEPHGEAGAPRRERPRQVAHVAQVGRAGHVARPAVAAGQRHRRRRERPRRARQEVVERHVLVVVVLGGDEEEVGLAARAGIPAGQLSHGEKRALELAIALALEPKMLLLDEPMAGTGHDETMMLAAVLKRLKGRFPMLLIEHDMNVVFSLADRVSVMVYGRILASGAPDAIRSDPKVVAAYLGEEAA